MSRFTAVLVPLALVALGFGAGRLFAEDAPKPAVDAKTEKVKKLLRDQGAAELAKATLDKMMKQFEAMPGLPEGFIEKFKEKADVDTMVDLSVPSYVKHLDEPTIDAIIAFYATPAGRKLSAALPTITMETMDAGMAWGQKAAMETMSELQKERAK